MSNTLKETTNCINSITNIEVLRQLVHIADVVITSQKQTIEVLECKIEDLEEELKIASEESVAEHADAERYTLLKFLLPDMLKKAAQLGPRTPASYFEDDMPYIEFYLDEAIKRGLLDAYRAAFEQQELKAMAHQEPVGEDGPLMAYGIPAMMEPLPVGIISDEY